MQARMQVKKRFSEQSHEERGVLFAYLKSDLYIDVKFTN
jgi:hypothetical protein